MGYSGRYHAASLAAVFVALAIGILIGVGLGSDVVSGTAEDLEASLESDLEESRAEVEALEAELGEEGEFGRLAHPALVAGRLLGADVGLIALGSLGDELTTDVREALQGTGASLAEVAVIREPPDGEALVEAAGTGAVGLSRAEALEAASHRAGRLLVEGGSRFDDLRAVLFSRYSGDPRGVDAVVVVQGRPAGLEGRDAANTDRLEQGLVDGLHAGLRRGTTGPNLVGVERSDAEESSVPFFVQRDVPTVDNIEELSGRVALVYALCGAEGNFGTKESADGLLPDLLATSGCAGLSVRG
ncbi:MAG: copper transporter [Solirubrobacterales bacterium]